MISLLRLDTQRNCGVAHRWFHAAYQKSLTEGGCGVISAIP
jgi:hypothetical protein